MPLVERWGASGWTLLHCVGFSYPEAPTYAERRDMLAFLTSVGYVLPCKKCRAHYTAYVNTHLRSPDSPALQNRDTLSRFLCDLHNDVNRRLGRPTMPYEDVRRIYTEDDDWSMVALCVAVVLAVAVVMHVRKK